MSGKARPRVELILDDLRQVTAWAADCAERTLPLFEAAAPSDHRPRKAIEGARLFGRGGRRTTELRSVALAAHAAAREVGDPAAEAAARAAGHAAASAYMHPLADRLQVKHALAPATYAALARELAAGKDPNTGHKEIRWAIQHAPLVVREIVRRYPAVVPGRSRLSALYVQIDQGLRSQL